MKTLFILNDPPYGTERSYNGLRLAGALVKHEDQSVRVFLLGDAAACARAGQKVPQGYYNLGRMLQVVTQHRGEIGVCHNCMEARGLESADLVPGSRPSTLDELADWTLWADRVLVF